MTIHWWNTDRIVERLAEGSVSEVESSRYAMIGVVLYFQATYFATWFGGYHSWLLIYEFFVVTAIGLVGVNECLKANGGAQGFDFLKRFSIISVPVGLKVALVATAIGQVVNYGFPYVVTQTTFRNPTFVYQLFAFSLSAAFAFIYYWRITIHLARIAKGQSSNMSVERDASPQCGSRPSP